MKVECTPLQRAKLGIMYQANECEQALKLADFTERESLPDIAVALRKLAAHHSYHAFQWVEVMRKNSFNDKGTL